MIRLMRVLSLVGCLSVQWAHAQSAPAPTPTPAAGTVAPMPAVQNTSPVPPSAVLVQPVVVQPVISAPTPAAPPPALPGAAPSLQPAAPSMQNAPVLGQSAAQPRKSAFLSGPGSLPFVVHHSLMLGLGAFAVQAVPAIDRQNNGGSKWWSSGKRSGYVLGFALGGLTGFGLSAWYQNKNYMSEESAYLSIVNSVLGGMFMSGAINGLSSDPTATSWFGLLGTLGGAWSTTLLTRGNVELRRAWYMGSGAVWGTVYSALFLAALGTGGVNMSAQTVTDIMLIMPAIGAGAAALLNLKFKPSVFHINRINAISGLVGGGLLVLTALVLGPNFNTPMPYIVGGIGAAATTGILAAIWDENAEPAKAQPVPTTVKPAIAPSTKAQGF